MKKAFFATLAASASLLLPIAASGQTFTSGGSPSAAHASAPPSRGAPPVAHSAPGFHSAPGAHASPVASGGRSTVAPAYRGGGGGYPAIGNGATAARTATPSSTGIVSAPRSIVAAPRTTATFNTSRARPTATGRSGLSYPPTVGFGGHSGTRSYGYVGSTPTYSQAPFDAARGWDRGRDHVWDHHRYHWSGGDWVIFDGGYPYSYDYGDTFTTPGSDVYDDDRGYLEAPSDQDPPASATGDGLTSDVQDALARRGYDPGPIDGVMGSETRSAIATFQRDQGLAATGRLDTNLLRRLNIR